MSKGKTKRVVTTTTTTAPDEDPENYGEPTEEEIQDDIAAEEFGAEWGLEGNRIRIRKMEGNRSRGIGTYPAELLSEQSLHEEHPEGGDFQLTLVGPDGRFIRKKMVYLGSLPASLRKAVPPSPAPASDPTMPLLIQMMQQHAQQQNQLLVAMLTRTGGGNGEKISDMIQAVVALNGAMKPPNQTELLTSIFELADKIKAGGETGWSVLKEALPVVMDRLGGLISPAPAPPAMQPMPVVVAPAETVTTGGPPPAPAAPVKTDYELLRETLTELKGYARRDKDVTTIVAFALERDDERGFELLIDAIDRFPFEQLIAYDAEISGDSSLRDWFFRFYSGVRNAVLDTVDSMGGSGNPGNPGANGGPGA